MRLWHWSVVVLVAAVALTLARTPLGIAIFLAAAFPATATVLLRLVDPTLKRLVARARGGSCLATIGFYALVVVVCLLVVVATMALTLLLVAGSSRFAGPR